jgi:hypothetical protein
MYEGPLIAWATVVQLVVNALFLLWIGVIRFRNLSVTRIDYRRRFLLFAAIFFASSVVVQLYYDHARELDSTLRPAIVTVGICISLVAGLLAVIGKGKGRIVTIIASAWLAFSWVASP